MEHAKQKFLGFLIELNQQISLKRKVVYFLRIWKYDQTPQKEPHIEFNHWGDEQNFKILNLNATF